MSRNAASGTCSFPTLKGERLSVHGVQYLLNKHRAAASTACLSLKRKRVTVHRLRHTMAMDLLQAGVDRSVIALWLGHERLETTQVYLEATLAMKEKALAKVTPQNGRRGRYKPGDKLLAFLNSVGPGRWPGQSGKELVLVEPFLHPETERRATEVSRFGSGVWLERRSLAWLQVPCAEQWLTVGASQLIPFGRVPSIAQLGRCLQLRKRATSEQDTAR